jgi:hypothetical protein
MVGADIAAIVYAVAMLGQTAARSVEQMKREGLSEEELQRAWREMQDRIGHANDLWLHATGASPDGAGVRSAAAPAGEEDEGPGRA